VIRAGAAVVFVAAVAAEPRVEPADWEALGPAAAVHLALVLERVKVPVRVAVEAVRAFG
jgi:hypothetical protein